MVDDGTARFGAPRRGALAAFAALAALAALCLVVHGRALGNGFVFDDHRLVSTNPTVRTLNPATHLFEPFWSRWQTDDEYYRPLTSWSLALDRALYGDSPAGYHATNLLLHVLTSWLLFLVARRLAGLAAAATTAALFALHPIQIESIAWVMGRTDLLAALFMMLALWSFARLRDSETNAWWYLILAPCSALALFAKEIAVTLPALWVGYHWAATVRGGTRRLTPLVAAGVVWVTVTGLYLALRSTVVGPLDLTSDTPIWDNPMQTAPTATRLLTAVHIAGRYLGLLIWPLKLSADYRPEVVQLVSTPWSSAFVLPFVGCCVAAAVAGLLARRVPLGRFGAVAAFGSYLLVSHLLFAAPLMMAERLLYVPMLGIAACVGAAAQWGLSATSAGAETRRRVILGCVTVAVILFGVRSWQRTVDWRDDLTLFAATVDATPRSYIGWFNLADARLDAGQITAAGEAFDRALSLRPGDLSAQLGLAEVAKRNGDSATAERLLRTAAGQHPESGNTTLQLLQLLAERASTLDDASAVDALYREIAATAGPAAERARVEAGSGEAAIFHMLQGQSLSRLRRTDEARLAFQQATSAIDAELNAGQAVPEARQQLAAGILLEAARFDVVQGQLDAAMALYERAIDLARRAGRDDFVGAFRAEAAVALIPSAEADLNAGRSESALTTYARILAFDPANERGRLGQARAHLGAGNVVEAERGLRELIEDGIAGRPAAAVWIDLARIAQARGDRDAAERNARRALSIVPGHPLALELLNSY